MRRPIVVYALGLLACGRPALAQVDPFEFEIYPAQTEGHGVLEVEFLNSVVPDGPTQGDAGLSSGDFASQDMYRTSIEVTYGLKSQRGGISRWRACCRSSAS